MKKILSVAFCVIGIAAIIWGLTDTLINQGAVYFAATVALMLICIFMGFSILMPAGTKTFFEKHKKGSLLTATVAGFVLVMASCLEPYLYADKGQELLVLFRIIEERLAGTDLFGYYAAQLSLTFISISVMSVLSDKSVIIYWANVSEDRLIRPTFSCFAAYTYYSIGATIGAGIGIALDNTPMFLVFFLINIAVLILLTISMIDVYYGRDTKKKKLVSELPSPFLIKDDAEAAAFYETCMINLSQNTLQASKENNISFLLEVYELYLQHPVKFDSDIGRETLSVMVSTLNAQTVGPFLRALDRGLCSGLSQFPVKPDRLYAKGDRTIPSKPLDTDLWSVLGSDRAASFLEQVSVRENGYLSPYGIMLAKVIMRRLTLEYNLYAADFLRTNKEQGEEIDPDLYFVSDNLNNSIYEPKTADLAPITTQRFEEVFKHITQTFRYDFFLFANIIRLIDRLLEKGQHWYVLKQLSALPYIQHWANEDPGLYDPRAIERLVKIFEEN